MKHKNILNIGIIVIALVALMGAGQWFRTLSVGTSAVNSSSIFDTASTTKGTRPAPSMTQAQRDAIGSPATGLLIYNTDTNSLNQYNGTGWLEVGSGSGGGSKNYISDGNSKFEQGIGDWAAFNDSSDYLDGTGGSSSLVLSVTTTASELLEGDQSLKIAKPASDVQYEGASVLTTTIDRADRGKVLYANISGDFSEVTTAGDWEVRAYDVTNSEILYTGTSGARSISNLKGLISVPVYTASTTASIRLSLHCTTTDATAYDIFIDEVKLGPTATSLVSKISEWESYTPTVINSSGGITNAVTTGKYRIVGDSIDIEITTKFSGASAAFTAVSYTIPSGYNIDFSKFPTADTVNQQIGYTMSLDDGSNTYGGEAKTTNSTTFLAHYNIISGSNSTTFANITNTAPFTFNTNDRIQSKIYRLPIVELAGNNVLTKTQLALTAVRARYTSTSAVTVPNSATVFNFSTKDFDNYNAVTTGGSWIFTSPRDGYYKATAIINFVSAASASRYDITFRKNGSTHKTAFLTPSTSSVDTSQISTLVYLEKGDTIDLTHFETVDGGSYTNNHEITIAEDIDLTLYGVVRAPVKWERMFLTGDVTADGTISDFAVSNIVVGQWYNFKVHLKGDSNTDDNYGVLCTHNSVNILRITLNGSVDFVKAQTVINEIDFQAESSSISCAAESISGTSALRGDSSLLESYVEIKETEALQEVSGF